jgi:SAM-dependent methyltransferase
MVCPCCAGLGTKAFRFGLVRCSECGLVYDPVAIERSRTTALQDEWFVVPDAHRSAWVRAFERRNNRRTLNRLRTHVGSSARVLDVGVGSGSLLLALRSAGYEPQGCDAVSTMAVAAERATGLPVHAGPLDTLDAEGSFDAIILNHVLEHTADPVALLTAAERLLGPRGILHVAVPNAASWEAHLPGWTSYEPYHLVYFTPATLRMVVDRAGLKVVQAETWEPFSGWFLALLRTALRTHSAARPPPASAPRPPRHSAVEMAYRVAMIAVGGALTPARRLQAWAGFGEEAIVIASKG